MLLNHQDSAQKWIDAGFAVRGKKGQDADLRGISFSHAQMMGLIYLSGKGANSMDREAIRHILKPAELRAQWR